MENYRQLPVAEKCSYCFVLDLPENTELVRSGERTVVMRRACAAYHHAWNMYEARARFLNDEEYGILTDLINMLEPIQSANSWSNPCSYCSNARANNRTNVFSNAWAGYADVLRCRRPALQVF